MITKSKFRKVILDHYKKEGRDFPWRHTKDPYRIMVSEIMLQQTQTSRVVPKYQAWLKRFPTTKALAQAPLADVLRAWQGLGYNRRALALQKSAIAIQEKYSGRFPATYEEILDLPGIGPYTAGAIMAFSYNKPVPIIETNIRTVFIHFFFTPKNRPQMPAKIHDKDIMLLIEKTLDMKNPRDWYHALMDYGAMLKQTIGNLNKNSIHYAKQSPFKGSNREIRAAILRYFASVQKPSLAKLASHLKKSGVQASKETILRNCQAMAKEGFLIKTSALSYIIKE